MESSKCIMKMQIMKSIFNRVYNTLTILLYSKLLLGGINFVTLLAITEYNGI